MKPLQADAQRLHLLFWSVLLLIGGAEIVTATVQAHLGLAMHALLLAGLLLWGGLSRRQAERGLALALTLAPLIRLLSLSLPLPRLPQMAWYPVVAIPLFIATWMIMRQVRVSGRDLGLRRGKLPVEIALMGGGFTLGVIEFTILKPQSSFDATSFTFLLLAAVSLIIFTGFTEELIFRGLLQSMAVCVLGRWALLYVSLLFGVLHIGYLSLADFVFVTLVGLLFAQIVRWGGSILGVAVAHGLTNLTLFVIMPSINLDAPSLPGMLLLSLLALGTASFIIATVYLAAEAFKASLATLSPLAGWRRPSSDEAQHATTLGSMIRHLRRNRDLSYFDLAQRSGIPVDQLIEIELGFRVPQPTQAQMLAQGLNIAPAMLKRATTDD